MRAGDRQAALIGRLLGVEAPAELLPDEQDPERLREAFFSALRSGIEAIAQRRPMVIAFEDIHWADDGMLDAIEHLAQWVRAPLMLVCLARDELLDRRPSWGGGRRSATQLLLEPLNAGQTRELVAALMPEGHEVLPAVVERSGGNPLFAEEMARRLSEDGGRHPAAGHRPGGARRATGFTRAFRAPAGAAGGRGRAHLLGILAGTARRGRGRDLDGALRMLEAKDILAPVDEGAWPKSANSPSSTC